MQNLITMWDSDIWCTQRHSQNALNHETTEVLTGKVGYQHGFKRISVSILTTVWSRDSTEMAKRDSAKFIVRLARCPYLVATVDREIFVVTIFS